MPIPLFKPGEIESIEQLAAGAKPPVAPPMPTGQPMAAVDQVENGRAGLVFPDASTAQVPAGSMAEGQQVPIEGPQFRAPLPEPPTELGQPVPPPGGPGAQRAAADGLQAAEADQLAAKADVSAAEADQAAQKADFDAERDARLAEHQKEAAEHLRAAKGDVAAKRARADAEPWTKLHETQSVGQKILQAIGLIASGVSWNSNHVNRGVELLKNAEDEHFALQKERHAALYKAVDDAEAGVKDLDASQLHEMADLQAREASRWAAIAGKTSAAIAAAKGRYDTSVLKQVHAEALSKSGEAHDNAVKAGATARHLDAETAKLEAETKEIPANSEANRRFKESQARYRALKAGGGKGAGGGAKMDELLKMQEDGAQPSEIAAKARELGIPAGGTKGYLGALRYGKSVGDTGVKVGEKAAQLEATDTAGKVIGYWKNPQEARKGNEQNRAFEQATERLKTLIADVKKNGARAVTPDELQTRLSNGRSVAAAFRVYNGLGGTDASQKLESDIVGALGTPGHGWLMGANLGVLERVLKEAENTHDARLKIGLRSTPPAGAPAQAAEAPKATESKPDKVLPDGRRFKWNGSGYVQAQ